MHKIAATPGGWNPQAEGVIFIQQTPAPIVFISAADTDIQTLAAAASKMPPEFPKVRAVNLLQLQQQLTIDTYAEEILERAEVIILRLLGGRSYWSYGLEVLRETVQKTNAVLIVMPGEDSPDPDLISHSNVSLSAVNQLWRYFTEGGVQNFVNALKFTADTCLKTAYNPPLPQTVSRVGIYDWGGNTTAGLGILLPDSDPPKSPLRRGTLNPDSDPPKSPLKTETLTTSCPPLLKGGWGGSPGLPTLAKVGILFYRAHYLSGNLAPIDALCQALYDRNLVPVPVFVSSLREPDLQVELVEHFKPKDSEPIQLLINTTSFAVSGFNNLEPEQNSFKSLDVPILQAIFSGGGLEQWETELQGLSPRDVAMNVALPEVDGKIITRAVSFKAVQTWNSELETDVVGYVAADDRISFVADLTANWVKMKQTPAANRRIAIILANYPTRNARLANGVGLDTPASCVEILKAMQEVGYQVDNIPSSGNELIEMLISGVTNDPEGRELRPVNQYLDLAEYQEYFATLPQQVQDGICNRWGLATGERRTEVLTTNLEGRTEVLTTNLDTNLFPIPGIQFGNVFVGIQPSRGYEIDPALNYHAPDLEPTHNYLAYYYWLREKLGIDAIIHAGKHGNLEWLPGKSVALSNKCYPEIALGALPNFYPFIVNDPGEGSQAKRRSQAVIIDHLTPPMTRAELYGPLQQLEALIDEYCEAQSLDPSRLPMIRDRIVALTNQENLDKDLGIQLNKSEFTEFITRTDGYLCELKESQIRDGLHIFGQCPQGRQLRDLIIAIARHPSTNRSGLTRALAKDLNLDFDPLTTAGDLTAELEAKAAELVDDLIKNIRVDPRSSAVKIGEATQQELDWISNYLLPSLLQTNQEITNLLRGLDGRHIPSGASGAPTRGRPDVLPTGRNFYSVDIRAIPTETAWRVGRVAAETLIERYTQENGEYPKTLGLSVWGTSTMRTGGDDIAEALALIGVQPIWDGPSRRVVDFEILPVAVLGRPRVDVTLRISGFFRDAFFNLIDLFDSAVKAVADLDESAEDNPLAAQVKQEILDWESAGLSREDAKVRSQFRVFGSKPGAYGAGLQGIIEAQNWTDDGDLAKAYINWSSYAYTSSSSSNLPGDAAGVQQSEWGCSAPEAFTQRLSQMQIVLQNQDNREHDILDSDDYYQFQGGMTAAIRNLQGKNPETYFGDNSIPENPKVRQLKEEIARVYRSRAVNPKWIEGAMRHGYKGAFEIAATVDFLFAYDATANCVEDFMYEGIAQAYIFDEKVQVFIQENNPWALRDMAERLLEARQRGLWESASQDILDKLRSIALEAEAVIESHTEIRN
ncbi:MULTISPECIES: cobaltochelatase subunit CobN [unclassified Microcoleus]|uniref:cobaltochelatase subunit CobN n=1 Tax=unclassified Microcoleus TaxID=2642155 RepID=UPI001DBB3FAE|nr:MULTISPECIES: cobaltochelatase subunit CobN [unclassified Microcoleus]MCC3507416.1 cobaltochelatase subunit CobN [Microcoleus sp. PH2017_19_SFW_U_A]TAE07013.1 MAG: cobaltochelatase subunit CobN [Oscillatoriales cyanobacterium]MCC3474307.1 cobaltochelatase subunit CobN [Microcoleus sp. PH2017_13_LAR_U_A]MCC3486742.1 cobaltochelatase subunit CobN [Microcoleus sp. PH2017_14_LAR_D_A]MCC3494374.1 cobaltochelatase subunit CobN [Microcoleus sp. PH2017_16_JOR_D_A]